MLSGMRKQGDRSMSKTLWQEGKAIKSRIAKAFFRVGCGKRCVGMAWHAWQASCMRTGSISICAGMARPPVQVHYGEAGGTEVRPGEGLKGGGE
eukprot:360025-Chlamydomonas_euryale.AAC.2